MQHKKEFVVKVNFFSLIAGHLYNMGPDEILCRYVSKHKRQIILIEAHNGAIGGDYARKTTTQKILRARLWWPTLYKDAKEYCQAYDVCLRIGKPSRRDEIPLVPQVTL